MRLLPEERSDEVSALSRRVAASFLGQSVRRFALMEGFDRCIVLSAQVLTAMIDFGLDPQQAAELPRWTSMVSGEYANYPHDGPDLLTIERRFSEEVCRDLARRGVCDDCDPLLGF